MATPPANDPTALLLQSLDPASVQSMVSDLAVATTIIPPSLRPPREMLAELQRALPPGSSAAAAAAAPALLPAAEANDPAAAFARLHGKLKALPPETKRVLRDAAAGADGGGGGGGVTAALDMLEQLDSSTVRAVATDLPIAARLVTPSALPAGLRAGLPPEALKQ